MSDDQTVDDLPPVYAGGPPTIEEQLSPFHEQDVGGQTIPGTPPPGMPQHLHDPDIRSRASTLQGVGGAAPALVPPTIINAPQSQAIPNSGEVLPLDGVTQADGLPLLAPGEPWDPPTDPDARIPLDSDSLATNPYGGRLAKGTVPSPDAPKVQVSHSMEWDVANIGDAPADEPSIPPKVAAARRRVAAPTEVMLPVLRKKEAQKKERSDVWLVVGLVVLVVVILGLLGAVIVGVLHRMG